MATYNYILICVLYLIKKFPKYLWHSFINYRKGMGWRLFINLLFWVSVFLAPVSGDESHEPEMSHVGVWRIFDFADIELFEWQIFGGLAIALTLWLERKVNFSGYSILSKYLNDDIFGVFLNFGSIFFIASICSVFATFKSSSVVFAEKAAVLLLCASISFFVFLLLAPFESEKKEIGCDDVSKSDVDRCFNFVSENGLCILFVSKINVNYLSKSIIFPKKYEINTKEINIVEYIAIKDAANFMPFFDVRVNMSCE